MRGLPAVIVAAALVVLAAPARSGLEVTALQVTPRLDLRARGGSPSPETLRIEQLELSATLSLSDGRRELVTFGAQGNLTTPMTGRAGRMHYPSAWAQINLGTELPKVRIGQFVVPFGTLAEYDTHGLLLQTPYARTLGIRLDRGIGFEGSVSDLDYWLALTGGDGGGRHEGGYAITARVAWDREFGDDFLRTGLSALVGRNNPVFATHPMSMPMDMDEMVMHTDKWRVAGDFDWLHGIDNIRAELVLGADDGRPVNGQWLFYNHPFSYDRDLSLQADRWRQGDGTSWGIGAQFHQRLDDLSGLRAAYERRWADRSFAPDLTSDTWTLQYYRDFAWAPSF